MNEEEVEHKLLNHEVQADLRTFVIYLFGFTMILIGGQASILGGWLFWFPLGLLTLPTVKYGIEFFLWFTRWTPTEKKVKA